MSIAVATPTSVKVKSDPFRPMSRQEIIAELDKSESDIKHGRTYKAAVVIEEIRHRFNSR